MSNALALLGAVRARLDRPEAWTQGTFWRDQNGEALEPAWVPGEATCFCLGGAARMEDDPMGSAILAEALGFKDAGQMFDWNDAPTRTHADITARLDEAIEGNS